MIDEIPGIAFRNVEARDEPRLRALYRETREPELRLTGWDEARKQAFCDEQYTLQDRHYRQHYPGAAFLAMERAGELIGRLYLHRSERELRVMDIALVTAARGAGLGTAILKAIQDDATREGIAVTLHVGVFNPAGKLYARLGFRTLSADGVYCAMRWDPPPRAS